MKLEEITACGECCTGCARFKQRMCPGCIEADGYVPEWTQSGRCRIHACAREHQARFCGLCENFPCDKLPKMIPWNRNIVQHLHALAEIIRDHEGI